MEAKVKHEKRLKVNGGWRPWKESLSCVGGNAKRKWKIG